MQRVSLDRIIATAITVVAFAYLIVMFISYIRATYIDVFYLDGMLQIPLLEKYLAGALTLQEFFAPWGEHRLAFYHAFFIANYYLTSLNAVTESYWFLLMFTISAIAICLSYGATMRRARPGASEIPTALSFLLILLVVYSLTHPPLSLMSSQFICGSAVFVILAIAFDRQLRGVASWGEVIASIVGFAIYVGLLSGAYFAGGVFSLAVVFAINVLVSRRLNLQASLSFAASLLFSAIYSATVNVTSGGKGLGQKLIEFFTQPLVSIGSILTALCGSNLDVHTLMERLGDSSEIVIANGLFLFAAGCYAMYRFFGARMYQITYVPLLLIFYTIGIAIVVRLGRGDGGWRWPMSNWYSFHLMYYPIGLIWILNLDLALRRSLVKVAAAVAILVPFYAVQGYSNYAQHIRSPSVRAWLEIKRQAVLYPNEENIKTLYLEPQEALAAIEFMKTRKVSTFRP
jgi:hypothetical protein